MNNYKINESDYELFTSYGGKFMPKVTISKPGGLSFSSGCYNKYDLAKHPYIQLLFSAQKNSIAIKLLDSEVENSVILKPRKDNKGGFAHVKSFINAHGLEKYYGKGFEPTELEHPELGKMLLIDLNKTI